MAGNVPNIRSTKTRKILILAANPNGLRLDQEIRGIEEAIKRANKRDQFEIRTRQALRPMDIMIALGEERPQIVHFCGHGKADGSLVLEDDGGQDKAVKPEALAELFELYADCVECVLVNACYSEKLAQAISQHIDYAIGMNQSVYDTTAIKFAQGFYNALGYGIPDNQEEFQRAFREGVVAIKIEELPGDQIPVIKKKVKTVNGTSDTGTNTVKSAQLHN
ncbi:MAG: hypothetical protein Fur006_51660 [Coleofasciculaceae cyanobacterium]